MTRTAIVLAGYLILGFAFYFQVPAVPQPKPIVPVTAAHIKSEVKREQSEKARQAAKKKYERAVAAARMVYRTNHVRETFSEITAKVAIEYGLSPRLLAGVVTVESHGNVQAKDGLGSVGLMQVDAKVWGHRADLTDPEKNIRIGANILSAYVRKYGLVEGLHHYNGYSEVHGHIYVNKVLTAAQIVVF